MPTLAQTSGLAKRVVVLSIDALKADMLWSILLNQSQLALDLPGFKYIFQNGFLAQGMIVSFPSSTAVSHAVISTGAPPGITGITGNTIHLSGTPLTSTVSGFNGSMLLAEPLWVTVDRQGLKAIVAILLYLGGLERAGLGLLGLLVVCLGFLRARLGELLKDYQ
jgi:predicted AlkP superfamily pyrophosphatase or phosphodiesterase